MELKEVVKISENFQAIHGINSVNHSNEPKFSEPRKNLSKVADTRKCYTCGDFGHISKFCGQAKKEALYSGSSDSAEKFEPKNIRACYICGDESHMAKSCVQKRGKKEHPKEVVNISLSSNLKNVKSLPLVKGKCNGKQVTILRDTGSTTIPIW